MRPLTAPRHSLSKSLFRPRLSQRSRPNSSSSSPGKNAQLELAQKKAQESLAQAQKGAEKLLEASQKYAGPVQERALRVWETTKKYAGPAGERAGKVWDSGIKLAGPRGAKVESFVAENKGPVLYNLAVAREFIKQVYHAERLQPPSWPTVKSSYETLFSRAKDSTFWANAVRSGEIYKILLYGVEAYGIFKIGEIVGRRHIVGYKVQ